MKFVLENPSLKRIKVTVKQLPLGFSIKFGDIVEQTVSLQANEVIDTILTWNPEYSVEIKKIVSLSIDNRFPLQVNVVGVASATQVRI